MPVFVPATPGSPLMQGDLLRRVRAYTTTIVGQPSPWDLEMVVVLSRNCAASRDKQILVASVAPLKEDLTALLTDTKSEVDKDVIKRLFRRFSALRDGGSTPNNLYVGELDGISGRATIRLNAIATIEVPDASEERSQWISERRVLTLSSDYRRHLQVKLFTSIAFEGFDEPDCFSDGDLSLFVTMGRTVVSAATAEVRALEQEAALLEAKGDTGGKRADDIRRRCATAKDKLTAIEADLETYVRLRDLRSSVSL